MDKLKPLCAATKAFLIYLSSSLNQKKYENATGLAVGQVVDKIQTIRQDFLYMLYRDLKTWCIFSPLTLLSFNFFVLSERDTLDRDIMELKKDNTLLEAALKSKSDNLLEVEKEVCLLI